VVNTGTLTVNCDKKFSLITLGHVNLIDVLDSKVSLEKTKIYKGEGILLRYKKVV